MNDTDDVKALKYEDAIEQLEDILDRIEAGDIGIEQALRHTERGAALIRHCRSVLDHVEQRVASLSLREDGRLAVNGEENDE